MTQTFAPAPGQLTIDHRSVPAPRPRARACGKFLFVGAEKLYLRGTTYGPFRPSANGCEYPVADIVAADFEAMAANGINAIRTYTVPPRWMLDIAAEAGLLVLVGIGWEQHVTFLDNPAMRRGIERRVRDAVRSCAGHPAVLGYAVGNEIPAPIVRWHGKGHIERFIARLYAVAKAEDPEALVTYVNYPTTEYLSLPFLDFIAFNVYLESKDRLEAYLARLHNLAGDKPLVMAEVGLDSRRNGDAAQSRVLSWQVRSTFAAGCAGVFLFAWTDEWFRGGYDIDDWDFGLTDRRRRPKPALAAVRAAFDELPVPPVVLPPLVSVVVCTHNGARTLADCLDGLRRLAYANYEVIVVDDASDDSTGEIAREFGVRVISERRRGLSGARNLGMQAARGEIIAYIDDDACPDPHWVTYLVAMFEHTTHAAIGGPNIAPPGDGFIADCVANAPGGPVHVLLEDQTAEHIPGCNMAFRVDRLREIGGFDPQFTAAGDDVDVCWRIQERGWTIGFSPAAMVWHHRRNSVRAYWRQQQGYGKAEALLEAKWPAKYNSAGHVSWGGRIYGNGVTRALRLSHRRVYQGPWGTAPFQSLYEPAGPLVTFVPMMPEWYLGVVLLATLAVLSAVWSPLAFAVPLLIGAVLVSITQAGLSALRSSFTSVPTGRQITWRHWLLTTVLHLLQPLARLKGRIAHGLTPWRAGAHAGLVAPWTTRRCVWSETWRPIEARLTAIWRCALESGLGVRVAGDFDRWDLEAHGGVLGAARLLAVTEEHGGGRQLVRYKIWPKVRPVGALLAVPFALLAGAALRDESWFVGAALTLIALVFAGRIAYECAAAMGAIVAGTTAEENPEHGAAALNGKRNGERNGARRGT